MNNISLRVVVVLVLIFSFSHVHANTEITDDISSDTTWGVDGSPYIIDLPTTIAEGATLTIDPGVVVKFNSSASLITDGSIKANGTNATPITFTSVDDTTSDSWGDIMFESSTPSVLDHVIERYSSSGLLIFGTSVSSAAYDSDQEMLVFDSTSSFDNLNVPKMDIYDSNITIDGGLLSNNDSVILGEFQNSSLNLKNLNVNSTGDIYTKAIEAFDASSLSLDNVTLDSGSAKNDGVEIFGAGSTLNISKSKITSARDGVSVYSGAIATVKDSTINCGRDCIMASIGSADVKGSKIFGASDAGIVSYDGTATSHPITINGNDIYHNNYGIAGYGASMSGANNLIHGNTMGAFNVDDSFGSLDLKNNWWGDPSGPENDTTNASGVGDKASDYIDFAPWCVSATCTAALVRHPVIIIPGVMGTEILNGPDKLWLDLGRIFEDGGVFMDALKFNDDLTSATSGLTVGEVIKEIDKNAAGIKFPIYDYSQGLIQEFNNQGYKEGIDLFTFPYDWRYGVSDDAVAQLKKKISDVLAASGSDKVDIIAHSTGGLIAKKYVMSNPNDNHIGKAVFVGVPNTGAPAAIKSLLVGNNFGIFFLHQDVMQKLSRNLPVVYDLSPSEAYYKDKGSYIEVLGANPFFADKSDLTFEQVKGFLINDHGFNEEAYNNANTLHSKEFDDYDLKNEGIDTYNIDGCKAGTIGKIIERQNNSFFGGSSVTYDQPGLVPGDGTVPLESSTHLPTDSSNKFYALKADHAKMLSEDGIRQEIVNILSGSTLPTNNITQDISNCKLKGRAISVYSPVNIDITDQDSNHSGLLPDGSIENNIPNASYDMMGDHKFVYLPNDEDQTYSITLSGTGTGVFTLTDTKIDNDLESHMQVFKDVPVTPTLTGDVNLGETTTLNIKTGGEEKTINPDVVLEGSDIANFDPTHTPKSESKQITSSNGGYVSGGGVSSPAAPTILSTLTYNYNPSKGTVINNKYPSTTSLLPVFNIPTLTEKPTSAPVASNKQINENPLTASAYQSKGNISKLWLIILGLIIIICIVKRLQKR